MTTMNTNMDGRKTSEFARLFDFFSRLASGDKELFVPKEFESLVDAIPVSPTSSTASLPGLCRSPDSTTTSISLPSVDTDYEEDEATQDDLKVNTTDDVDIPRTPVIRGRRTSIAVVRGRGTSSRLARFPLAEGSNPQFTFKLMIHELYDINDFTAMVQEVLATSQKRFQPLPESLKGGRRASVGSTGREGDGVKGQVNGRFPQELGLGRPSGLDVPVAERTLKKRRVGRRRSVSGGPMDKEPDWVDAAALPDIDFTIEEIPRINVSTVFNGPTPRPALRTRKFSVSSARSRVTSNAQKRMPAATSVAREAPVVRYAETFLNIPAARPTINGGRFGRLGSRLIERARSEEPEFLEMPMSAPSTRDTFSRRAEVVEAKTIRAKRRLSFST